jgi:hypothetical protein
MTRDIHHIAHRSTHPSAAVAGTRERPLRTGPLSIRQHRFCTPVVHELPRRRTPDPPGAAGW